MDNINTALYGEYYVAAMLYKRGWTANLTLKNYPGIDIFGFNLGCQVKRLFLSQN